VFGHVALEPLDVGPEVGDHLVRLGGDRLELVGRQLAGTREWTFDHVLGHVHSPRLEYRTHGTDGSIPSECEYAYREYGCQGAQRRSPGGLQPQGGAGSDDARGAPRSRSTALRRARLRRYLD